ncbi:MAG TPA: glycosyl hydrolase [Blastocatellia bacterium]|nr:glycosyl hydrolase [Blastocatellia bacterium]
MPEFTCDLSETGAPLTHFWEHTVGSDHAPVALRADWQNQLRLCHNELGFRYVRFHGLLSDDMGTLISHQGASLSSFFNADQVFDFLLSIGMRPFVELSFMPTALASGHKTVFHYRANVTPPRDYQRWATFIRELVSHWVERYGVSEVRKWFFEVWNEPNLKAFWAGTQADYFKLYRYAAHAVKSVDGELQVGGPATAANEWIEEFLDFCEKNRLPADFISTHHYPTDAFGNEGDDTLTQLAKSRRSILREQTQNAKRRSRGKPLYYTEWNASSNPRDSLHDEPYAAAFAVKTIMEANGLVEGYSFWTFSDIFEENYFPSKPFHGGFGLLNIHGIPKPTYRAFELLHSLGNESLLVDGLHETVDAWVVRGTNKITVLLTNYALPRHHLQKEHVKFQLGNAPEPVTAYVQRIDEDDANPRRLWKKIGAPEYLSSAQLDNLLDASRMRREPLDFRYTNGRIEFKVTLPANSVAALEFEFRGDFRLRGLR